MSTDKKSIAGNKEPVDDGVYRPRIAGEITGVQEQRIPLTDSMKRTLTSLLVERSQIDAAINDLVQMFAAQAGVNGTGFQLDMAAGVIIAKVPHEDKTETSK